MSDGLKHSLESDISIEHIFHNVIPDLKHRKHVISIEGINYDVKHILRLDPSNGAWFTKDNLEHIHGTTRCVYLCLSLGLLPLKTEVGTMSLRAILETKLHHLIDIPSCSNFVARGPTGNKFLTELIMEKGLFEMLMHKKYEDARDIRGITWDMVDKPHIQVFIMPADDSKQDGRRLSFWRHKRTQRQGFEQNLDNEKSVENLQSFSAEWSMSKDFPTKQYLSSTALEENEWEVVRDTWRADRAAHSIFLNEKCKIPNALYTYEIAKAKVKNYEYPKSVSDAINNDIEMKTN